MRVLFVCTEPPFPPRGGASLRTGGWIRALEGRVDVRLLTTVPTPAVARALREAQPPLEGSETVLAARTSLRRAHDALKSVVTGLPYPLVAARSRALERAVQLALAEHAPDLVQAELLPAALSALSATRARGVPLLYSAHNVESRVAAAPSLPAPLRALRRRRVARLERRVAAASDGVVAVSSEEAEWLGSGRGRVRVIPNAVHLEDCVPTPAVRRSAVPTGARPTLGFFGHLGYPPNRGAAVELAESVFPRVRAELPAARCVIAGRSPGRRVRALRGGGVEVIADPVDAASIWRRLDVLVCALRWGAGSRLKLLEAAAHGVPVVASRFSAEGLELVADRDYLAGEDAEGLAESCLAVLGDRAFASALAGRARSAVAARHAWRVWDDAILSIYEELVGHHGAERGGVRGRADRGRQRSDSAAR